MTIKISFPKTAPRADTAAILVYKGNKLDESGNRLDRACGGAISRYLKKQKKFSGKKGQVLTLAAPDKTAYARIVLLGADTHAALDAASCEATGGRLYAALMAAGAVATVVHVDKAKKGAPDVGAHLAMGLRLRSYTFTKYKSKNKENDAVKPAVVHIPGGNSKMFADLDKAAAGVFFARDLSNEPPNVLYPESFARLVKKDLARLGVRVEIFDHARMKKMGFGAHLAVGQGSARPPRVVVMRWNGTKKKTAQPLAFVGKGVTFDTGGISIKPAASMDEMKHDMSGAAAVAGLMKTLALRKAKVNVIGIVGLAENMPSHNAYRPGDIIKSLSGKTIEVLNTDAEGRLVLCDALTYVQKTHNPRFVIDLATLTGAIVVALGAEYAGAFVNDNALWKQLEQAAGATGEKLWRMPLHDSYRKEMDSTIADLKNTGNGRDGGSCTAAGFLQNFIDDKRAWAHLDIAGTAWTKKETALCPKGATGFGARLLNDLVRHHYE